MCVHSTNSGCVQSFLLVSQVFCKLPIQSMTRMEHLKHLLMMRIILSVFQSHINARCDLGSHPWIAVSSLLHLGVFFLLSA